MKQIVLIALFSLSANFSFSQTDSTDLNLYMTDPILLDEMGSLMFNTVDFGEMFIEFDVTDTLSFGGVNIEIITSEDGEVLYKGVFSKTDLLSNGILNTNWHATIDLGKLEKGITYTISFVVKDYNGLLGETITKQFIYAGN